MINWSRLLKGKSFSLHYHEDMSEIFIILNGKVEIEVDNPTSSKTSLGASEKEILRKGDLVIIPAKSKHKMWNRSEEDVSYIAMGIAHGEGGKTVNI